MHPSSPTKKIKPWLYAPAARLVYYTEIRLVVYGFRMNMWLKHCISTYTNDRYVAINVEKNTKNGKVPKCVLKHK